MRPVAAAVLATALAFPAAARGEPDGELRAAQAEIKLARTYLQAAPGRYEGARRRALDHVKQALRQVRLALLDAASEREHGAEGHDGDPPRRRPPRDGP
jgi:hypothetical protein